MLDLRRLEILSRFSTLGSIAATASSLGYSAAAISQQLATLERETGVALFERTARSATLTNAGRLLAAHATALLAKVEQAESELAAQAATISGELTISTIPSLAPRVARALATVQREHPKLDILMRQTDSTDAPGAVAARLSDIAIIDDWNPKPSQPRSGLTLQHIATDPIVLAIPASDPLARESTTLTAHRFARAIRTMTWLCAPAGHLSRNATDQRLADWRAAPARRWEFEGLTTIAQLVAAGIGCALLPDSVVQTQPPKQIHHRTLSPKLTRHLYVLSRASTTCNPATIACIAIIIEQIREQNRL